MLHWFTPESLRRLAGRFGFEMVARGRPTKRIVAAHVKSLLSYRLGGSLIGRALTAPFALLPDRLSVRCPAEDLFWMLLARKPPTG